MIPPVNIRFENLPDIRTDYSEQFDEIGEYFKQRVTSNLAEGGIPPWERTTYGAIARLYDRFASTIQNESDHRSAEVSVGGTRDTFAHHFGAEFNQIVTERQRGFFWHQFYTTDVEMWKWMALTDTLHVKIPRRPLIQEPTEEDKAFVVRTLGHSIFDFSQTGGFIPSHMREDTRGI